MEVRVGTRAPDQHTYYSFEHRQVSSPRFLSHTDLNSTRGGPHGVEPVVTVRFAARTPECMW